MESMKIRNKAVAGDNDTSDNVSPVTTILVLAPWSVIDTCEQFIAGCVDTGDKHKVFVKIWNGPNSLLRGQGETDSWKNLEWKISCQTPFKKNARSTELQMIIRKSD